MHISVIRAYALGYSGHLFGGESEFRSAEVHVVAFVHRHEVNVGVGDIEADYGDSDFLAGDGFFESFGHPLGKEHKAGVFLVGKVEDIVDLLFGDYEHMARMNGVDVEKCEIILVFGYFIRRDLAGGDA